MRIIAVAADGTTLYYQAEGGPDEIEFLKCIACVHENSHLSTNAWQRISGIYLYLLKLFLSFSWYF